MRSWFGRHWRFATAGTLIVALVATVGVWTALRPTETPDAVDCSRLEAADFTEARAIALACESDVEVLEERTPWHTSYATANGGAALEVATVPTHVEKDGEWVPIDTTLVEDPETGAMSVAAGPFPMELNGGGEEGEGDPLGSLEREGKTFDVWFPLDLPDAEISGSQAFYEIGEGIRLIVSVRLDGAGFLPVVELADAAAAARFTALLEAARLAEGGVSTGMDLEYVTEASEGLSLVLDDQDAVNVVDAEGVTHFVATPPVMWDSSGESIAVSETATEVGATDRTRSPGENDRIAMMGVEIVDDTIVIAPDAAMLDGSETVWPVYIDPSFGPQTSSEWVAVRTGGYTGTLYNWGDISPTMKGQGVGHCTAISSCNVDFYQRLVWEYSGLSTIANLAGTDITSAVFRVDGTHSYNCTSQPASLYRTSAISTGSTWANVSWLASVYTKYDYHSNSCGNLGYRNYTATSAAVWVADNNQSTLTLGLVVDESSMLYWKRFRHDATLRIDYNRAPNQPTDPKLTSPNIPGCVTGSGRPVIATTTPTLSAIGTDPDAGTMVQMSFEVLKTGTTAEWSSGNLTGLASGSRASVAVPSGELSNGNWYAWRARAYDGARYSTWTAWCEFAVDTAPPPIPTVTPVTGGGAKAVYVENAERGGVGQQGFFTINRGAGTDVVSFSYGFNAPTMPNTVAVDGSGNATISFTPSTTGTVTLTVKARDAAGNFSTTRTYVFSVATPTEDGIWTLDEGSGTTAADSAGSPARPLTLTGSGWGNGPHDLFDSRTGDRALVLDGVNDFAATGAPVIDTTDSFAVSAHVLVDAGEIGGSGSFTALSQDGVAQFGFRVGYVASCAGMTGGCWSFSMTDTFSGTATTVVQSAVPVTGDEWTHLVAEYDATDDQMRLWVCEVGTPEDPAVGEPVRSEVARTATPWAASGAFQVGRDLAAGAYGRYWPGSIDNIRVFSGEVVSESKIRRLCQGAEATDFGAGESALDPTTTVGE